MSAESVRNYFDEAICINLDTRPDRWEQFCRELFNYAWELTPITRFSALTGADCVVPEPFEQYGGHYGCMASHTEIWLGAQREDVDRVLVLEDDAYFASDFHKKALEFMRAVPPDWDMVYLGGNFPSRVDVIHSVAGLSLALTQPTPVNDKVMRAHCVLTTHAYAITRAGIRKVLPWVVDRAGRWYEDPEQFEQRRLFNIDRLLCEYLYTHAEFKAYCPTKWLVGQRAGYSDLLGFESAGLSNVNDEYA